MPDYLTKHDFVDDNPYICYAPDVESGSGSIPIASADTLGCIKVGDNLSITEGGVLSASGGGGGGEVEPFIVNGEFTLDQDSSIETGQLDKTWNEIKQAVIDGKTVSYNITTTQINVGEDNSSLTEELYGVGVSLDKIEMDEDSYIYIVYFGINSSYQTNNPDDYPQYPNT